VANHYLHQEAKGDCLMTARVSYYCKVDDLSVLVVVAYQQIFPSPCTWSLSKQLTGSGETLLCFLASHIHAESRCKECHPLSQPERDIGLTALGPESWSTNHLPLLKSIPRQTI